MLCFVVAYLFIRVEKESNAPHGVSENISLQTLVNLIAEFLVIIKFNRNFLHLIRQYTSYKENGFFIFVNSFLIKKY